MPQKDRERAVARLEELLGETDWEGTMTIVRYALAAAREGYPSPRLAHSRVFVEMDARPLDADLRAAGGAGLDLSGTSWLNANASGLRFNGARLDGATFAGANLARAEFHGADLTETTFNGADLTGAVFRHCVLGPATLRGVRAYSTKVLNCEGAAPDGPGFLVAPLPGAGED
jgi:uncharacterized protein YjbI with pentapeptide repeats